MTPFSANYRGKKVLITGHTGFKGSWLTQWLVNAGAEVAGYSVDVPTDPSHFKLLGLDKKIRHEMGDIRDSTKLEKLFAAFQPEFVFHLAAQSLVRASYDDPVGTFDVNVMGTVRVFEAVRKTPSVKAFVNVTSDKCYENFELPKGYRETDHLGGKDPYSASKGAAEIVFGSYRRAFLETRAVGSVRAGNVIGGGDWAKDRIVPDCVRAWSKKEKVVVRNPGSIRPWQHVLEPLSGYLWFGAKLAEGKESGEAYNFGPRPEANQTVEHLITAMRRTWANALWNHDPSGTGNKKEAGILMLDCSKAAEKLHWRPALSFEESVGLTARWYRDYYESANAQTNTSHQIREYETLARERGFNGPDRTRN